METLRTAIEFVSNGTASHGTAQTGDSFLFVSIIAMLLCMVGLVFTLIQKQRIYSCNYANYHSGQTRITNKGWSIATIVFSVLLTLSFIGTIGVITANKAFADNSTNKNVPEKIKAIVDDNTGGVTIEDGYIQSNGTDKLLLKSIKIAKSEEDGDCNYALTLDGNEIFNGKANTEKTFDSPFVIDNKQILKITTNMTPDIAKNLVGKAPLTIEYTTVKNIEHAINLTQPDKGSIVAMIDGAEVSSAKVGDKVTIVYTAPADDPTYILSTFDATGTSDEAIADDKMSATFIMPYADTNISVTTKKFTGSTATYVVSLWGAGHSGDPGVATFGPATGKSRACLDHKHKEGQGCIHNDDWATIKANLEANPHYYDECIKEGCTKNIELNLNATIASKTADTYNASNILYKSINPKYRKWNYRYHEINIESARWTYCRLRSTLNGKENMPDGLSPYAYAENQSWTNNDCLDTNNCLLSCFPTELKDMIVAKTYKVPFSWDQDNFNITESRSVTDKLWLPSTNEIFGTSPKFKDCDESSLGSLHYATRLSAEDYAGSEGITYDNYEFNKVYNEISDVSPWWMRSPIRGSRCYIAAQVAGSGFCNAGVVSNQFNGFAPCFCL